MTDKKTYHEFIRSRGVSLAEHGIEEYALPRRDALAAIDMAGVAGLPILGGDVVHLEHGRLRYPGDSWHCDRQAGEPYEDYVQRSLFESKAYVAAYLPTLTHFYFVIVAGD